MDLKEIRQLIAMLKGTDVTEIELRRGDQVLRLNRSVPADPATLAVALRGNGIAVSGNSPFADAAMLSAGQALAPQNALRPADAASHPVASAQAEFPNAVPITSPMVGTFYHATSPEAPPFVKVGDVVKKDQILCIIEAMKLMNEIEAERPGRIVKILKDNASPVEFGEEFVSAGTGMRQASHV
ncbi:acetyl-CoA carboxylase biotin carboxyl carrier protein [Candidatus Magnetobacterium casense]|uniref:acetyl-CoA carboxylase biotin carboxyl carrier protein n=1 Tax=Candidatus Magnetobacterium casense TaxID=1455061 RepID=UPI0006961BDF|nr:acetyl-CoA carboxylase biotin carboxyl carrier protein [Candidatus Magnetobacterium casensis]